MPSRSALRRKCSSSARTTKYSRWRDDCFELVGEFATSGATDAASFVVDDQRYLVVSNSPSEGVRFRTDSTLYRFDG